MRTHSQEKQREYDRRYRQRHPEKIRAKKKRHYAALKLDPKRLAKYKQYHQNYNSRWEYERKRLWVWNGFCLVRKWVQVLQEPLPRFDD